MKIEEAQQIGETLGATHDHLVELIHRIGCEMGLAWVEQMAEEAREVEAAGGMRTWDGVRRTPVGVLFELMRARLPEDKREELLPRRPPKDTEVSRIAEELGETERKVMAMLHRIHRAMGGEWMWQLVDDAKEVEASGGMLVQDGSGRRTLGGIFFKLVRERIPADKKAELRGKWKRKSPGEARPVEGAPEQSGAETASQ
jgi:hypothetical protein